MDDMDLWDWQDYESYQSFLLRISHALAECIFLSDDQYSPAEMDHYNLGYLEPEDWWPLVNQLGEMVDLETLEDSLDELDDVLEFPGLPSELLEAPISFLATVLAGDLPREPSGRRVGSRKLVKIAQKAMVLLQAFPESAQAAVRAWANVHRADLFGSGPMSWPFGFPDEDELTDLLFVDDDLPPAVTGFSMMIGLTLMRWPERAEGLPLPAEFLDPTLYDEVLAQWEMLPDNPSVTEEGSGEAEALFAQGQLAYMLAQMGAAELVTFDELEEQDVSLVFSRLSRAVLWVHEQCRSCPEREGVACRVATNWPERPVPLLEVSAEIANSGRIAGCVRMQEA
jgi:hypothetical protein